jgi:hypothetical protein
VGDHEQVGMAGMLAGRLDGQPARKLSQRPSSFGTVISAW